MTNDPDQVIDMQIADLPAQKYWANRFFFIQKVKECSGAIEKSIFRFLVFEIWLFKILRIM